MLNVSNGDKNPKSFDAFQKIDRAQDISRQDQQCNNELIEAAEKWRTHDLSKNLIKYMFIDGVCFDMRIGKNIESVPVLVAIGIKKTGEKLVLGLQAGDKESALS